MKVLSVGGGSGGHVTPVVAVLHELKQQSKSVEIRFWVDRGFYSTAKKQLGALDPSIRVDKIASGKFRRFYHVPMWRQLLWPSVLLPNLRDGFKVIFGGGQSLVKLIRWRPDVVFAKGGFVCLPVGWAAHVLRIPLVIHDSDAHPGLTNRILSHWAVAIGTGAPLEFYHYPESLARYVGIPVSSSFIPVSDAERRAAKQAWHADPDRSLVVVTGGGLGATRINQAVMEQHSALVEAGLTVVLLSGSGQYEELKTQIPAGNSNFRVYDFISDMPSLLRTADLVVARAGATTMAELAVLHMPAIIIPNARLTGGHQLKNAAVFAEANAIKVLDEESMVNDSQSLFTAINQLLNDPAARDRFGASLGTFARPDAAQVMAEMIIVAASQTGTK